MFYFESSFKKFTEWKLLNNDEYKSGEQKLYYYKLKLRHILHT